MQYNNDVNINLISSGKSSVYTQPKGGRSIFQPIAYINISLSL